MSTVKSIRIDSLDSRTDACKAYLVFEDKSEKYLGRFRTGDDAERAAYNQIARINKVTYPGVTK